MIPAQLNTGLSAFTNIDKLSLHTGNPGNTGDSDSGETHQTITWSTPQNGYMYALITFSSVVGEFPYIGLWDGSTFITSRPLGVTLPAEQDLTVYLEARLDEKS